MATITSDKPVAVVTGATSGIGKATAMGLARAGFQLVLPVRDVARGRDAAREITGAVKTAHVAVESCDLQSLSSVRAAAKSIRAKHPDIQVLVNCAGVFLPARRVSPDGIEATFATNYLGPFLLTNELLPSLRKGAPSRIVNVASRYGGTKIDFTDLNFERRPYSYMKVVPPSKLAQVLFTQELAERLKGTGVTVHAAHPGLVKNTHLLDQTGGFFRWMTNTMGGTAEKGADTPVWLATAPEPAKQSGNLWAKRKVLKTPGQGSDPEARRALWKASERMAGLKPTP